VPAQELGHVPFSRQIGRAPRHIPQTEELTCLIPNGTNTPAKHHKRNIRRGRAVPNRSTHDAHTAADDLAGSPGVSRGAKRLARSSHDPSSAGQIRKRHRGIGYRVRRNTKRVSEIPREIICIALQDLPHRATARKLRRRVQDSSLTIRVDVVLRGKPLGHDLLDDLVHIRIRGLNSLERQRVDRLRPTIKRSTERANVIWKINPALDRLAREILIGRRADLLRPVLLRLGHLLHDPVDRGSLVGLGNTVVAILKRLTERPGIRDHPHQLRNLPDCPHQMPTKRLTSIDDVAGCLRRGVPRLFGSTPDAPRQMPRARKVHVRHARILGPVDQIASGTLDALSRVLYTLLGRIE
jgi:hypothetical protein